MRQGEPRLAENLNAGRVRGHPFVIGELALGSPRQREVVLGALKDLSQVELATLEWVSWFNHHRLLEPIGYVPPAEAEANYYRSLTEQVLLA